ncbi:MAG: hypothetical protein IKS48_00330 [Eubacterium sp.]|nr:hypothetical protein [Eubacterium sp.]
MTEEKLNKLWYKLEDEEKKAEVEYCKMFNSTPDEVPLNEMVRFRSGYCMGRHYGYLAGLKAGRPQWHTDPNDLPKMIEDERKISQDVWLHIKDWGREVGYYDYHKNYWVVRCRQVNLPIIAWCEIPTFDKE